LAGLLRARKEGIVSSEELAVLDATAHALKFAGFQENYFDDNFNGAYEIVPKDELRNFPTLVEAPGVERQPASGKILSEDELQNFVEATAREIARKLDLQEKGSG
jgi:threonine synthase